MQREHRVQVFGRCSVQLSHELIYILEAEERPLLDRAFEDPSHHGPIDTVGAIERVVLEPDVRGNLAHHVLFAFPPGLDRVLVMLVVRSPEAWGSGR